MAKADVSREIRRAVDTGKVIFGAKQSEKSLKNGSGKLLVIAGNIPNLAKEKLVLFADVSKVRVLNFEGTGLELGSVCGKPFTITSMVVEEEGKSKVLETAKM